MCAQVKAVLHFVVDGTVVAVDLKSGSGAISVGKDGAPKADLTVTITDENLVKVANGTLSPQMVSVDTPLTSPSAMAHSTYRISNVEFHEITSNLHMQQWVSLLLIAYW